MKTSPASKNRSWEGERPFVLVNMSMTADGKIATSNRQVSSFGSKRDHDHLLELRATADAVMCGARTADLNDIHLGTGGPQYQRLRLRNGLNQHNLRIVVSGNGTLNPSACLFNHSNSPVIVLTTARANEEKLKKLREVANVRICGGSQIEWPSTLAMLSREHGVRRLLSEGGGALNAALFHADLVDELHLTICPWIIGGDTAPTIADGPVQVTLADASKFQRVRWKRKGDEMFCLFRKATG